MPHGHGQTKVWDTLANYENEIYKLLYQLFNLLPHVHYFGMFINVEV